MGKLKDKIVKISGRFAWVVNGDDICTVARAVNCNADVLEELSEKVERLEKQIGEIKQNDE